MSCTDKIILGCFDVILQRFHQFPFPNRDASVHRDWPADVRYVAAEDGARIAEKGELGVALGTTGR